MIFSFILLLVGCKVDEIARINPDGNFAVNFSLPEGTVYAPAKFVPVNRSKYSESYKWTFEGAKTINKEGQLLDINTSTSLVPDTVFYRNPGTYKITLEASQGGNTETIMKEVTVVKMTPQIITPQALAAGVDLQFDVNAFEYEDKTSTYSWDFGVTGKTSTLKNPIVNYDEAGIYNVTLTINDGEETLIVTKQIRVLGELVKTIYFTDAITKKIYKYRMTVLEDPKVEATGISTGIHPFGMGVYNNRLYIAETGAHVNFQNAANADGRIYSVSVDGTSETTLTTATGNYQQDPFFIEIDQTNGTLYFLTRNFNVRSIASSVQDAPYPTTARFAIVAANAGTTSVFNWVDGAVRIVGNEVWYSKHANGKGLYKFNAATGAYIGRVEPLLGLAVKNFIIDEQNSKLYFYLNSTAGGRSAGLYKSNLDGSSIELIDALIGLSSEGGATELAGLNGMVLDNVSGYLYYGFRAESDISATGAVVGAGANSGIKRFKLDGTMTSPEFLFKGYAPYAITLDNVRR